MAFEKVNERGVADDNKIWALLSAVLKKLWQKDSPVQQKMVGWYSPSQLLRTSTEVWISSVLGRHADRRSIEASNRPPKYFDFSAPPKPTAPPSAPQDTQPTSAPVATQDTGLSKVQDEDRYNLTGQAFPLAQEQGTLWIDYVSDLGDGWNSTYAVAYQLAQESFTVQLPDNTQETLCRGNILIFGGDEVYPTAEREEYENRLVAPYKMSLPTKPDKPSFLFALPGNHDWYDSLSSFIEFFGDFERSDFAEGRWHVPQNRSYFALKLPKGWWILGVDVQLQSDLDHWQFKYFEKVVQMIQKGERVILCCAEPYWMYNKMYDAAQRKYEKSNLKRLVDLIDPKNVLNEKEENDTEREKDKHIALFLAGDLHHYFRVLNHERTELSITAGGGGAFLHPTHGLVQRAFKTRDGYQTRGYPTPRQSWWLGLWNFAFPFFNLSFGLIPGVLYLLFSWFLILRLGPDGVTDVVPAPNQAQSFVHYISPAWRALAQVAIYSPFMTFFMLAMIVGFILFTKTEPNAPYFRWWGGTLHGLSHICAATFTCLLGFIFYKSITPENTDIQMGAILLSALLVFGLGGLFGSFLMGVYLFLSLNICGQHITAAFSSLKIQDWKNFLRLKLDLETGELTIYPIGLRRVPRAWEPQTPDFNQDPRPENSVPGHYKPKDNSRLQIELIEGPIKLTPHKKKGVEISFPLYNLDHSQ